MRLARVMHAMRVEMLVVALEPAQDLPGAIRRHVVDRVDAVAEPGDVPDRLLDEQILVVDEDNADDPGRRYNSSCVQSSSGRTTPRNSPVKSPRAESPSAGSKTWKATILYARACGASFGEAMVTMSTSTA
jgi:hypothetical protein